jgi:hypothetical protein
VLTLTWVKASVLGRKRDRHAEGLGPVRRAHAESQLHRDGGGMSGANAGDVVAGQALEGLGQGQGHRFAWGDGDRRAGYNLVARRQAQEFDLGVVRAVVGHAHV